MNDLTILIIIDVIFLIGEFYVILYLRNYYKAYHGSYIKHFKWIKVNLNDNMVFYTNLFFFVILTTALFLISKSIYSQYII